MTFSDAGIDRREAWRGARLLGALTDLTSLPMRYRAWGRPAVHPGFGVDDIAEAAQWPVQGRDDLAAFLCCIGAAAHAAAWRSMLDGEWLRRLAAAVSEPLVEAVFALDPLSIPPSHEGAQDIPDRGALIDLGRRLLLASLPVSAFGNEAPDPVQARLAVEAGATLLVRTAGAACTG